LKDRAGLQNAERRKEAMVLTLPCSCRAGTWICFPWWLHHFCSHQYVDFQLLHIVLTLVHIFFIVTILVDARWELTVLSVCIFLMVSTDVELFLWVFWPFL
jgi:hypothetical protein